MSATWLYGQTPSLYDKVLLGKINVLDSMVKVLTKRVDTLIWANTKMLALIQIQDDKIKAMEDSLMSLKKSMVLYNKLTFITPLEATKDTIPNSWNNNLPYIPLQAHRIPHLHLPLPLTYRQQTQHHC